ncbi:unnamed protein product [Clonostachys rosea]|uniref:Uncharacterized protein n=1 Tax=Bionectria ochroleuca TaxID=29856 RepID=A0ABY6UEP9_BIOOC|nr:unnamed protein product [Clonostachys rosea]
MVAIKQLSAIPLVLALSSVVVASDVSGDLVARDDNVDLGVRVNDGQDIASELEARGAGMSKPKAEKPKPKISKPTLIGGTNPIAMNGNTLKPSNHRSSTVSTTSSNGDPFYLEKYVKKGKRDDLEERGAGMSKPKAEKPKPKISKPTLIGGTHPVAMSGGGKSSGSRASKASSTSSHGDPFYLEKYVKKGKRGEDIYERDEDDLFERDEDDELFEREFEDELYERDEDDELFERELEFDLYERDFEDDLFERDEDDELFEREFDDELYVRGSGNSKAKAEKPKPKISKPTLIGGTHPVAMSGGGKSSADRASKASSTSSHGDPFYLEKYVKKGKRGFVVRGAGMSKPKAEKPKPKISKPTLIGGTHPVTMSGGGKSGGSRASKASSTSSHGDPFYLEKYVKKGKRGLGPRGSGNSKAKAEKPKPKISKPTLIGGTHPVTMAGGKSSADRASKASSTSSHGDPFYLEKYVKKGKRGLRARGSGNSKAKAEKPKPKISKPTLIGGTHPVTMAGGKSSADRASKASSTSSHGDPFYLEKYVKKGKRAY